MATDLELANMALGMVAQDRVVSLDNTVNSKSIATVNMYLPRAKEETLRARDWNAVRGRATLALLPTDRSLGEWTYSYRLPVDCLCMRRFIAFEDPATAFAKYSVEIDSENKKTLLCDVQFAKIVYTRNITDVNRWDSMLLNVCATKLAWYLAPAMVKDFTEMQVMREALEISFNEAVGVDEAEGQLEIATDSTLIDVRF
jgi:hypothetical protein